MRWEKNEALAIALRNQGLADCLAARFALRHVDLTLFGEPVTFAHLVVSKSQQSVEKLTKGYLLWHSQSFDPTKGHSPFTEAIEDQSPIHKRALARLTLGLRLGSKTLVRDLKWLESLAPKPAEIAEGRRGDLQPLEIIRENTEYPYWSEPMGSLVAPARGITLRNQGLRAFGTLRTYLKVLSQSDPDDYCGQIRDFLVDHPMSTEIMEWPKS